MSPQGNDDDCLPATSSSSSYRFFPEDSALSLFTAILGQQCDRRQVSSGTWDPDEPRARVQDATGPSAWQAPLECAWWNSTDFELVLDKERADVIALGRREARNRAHCGSRPSRLLRTGSERAVEMGIQKAVVGDDEEDDGEEYEGDGAIFPIVGGKNEGE